MGYLYPDLSKVSDYSDFEVSDKNFYKKCEAERLHDRKMKTALDVVRKKNVKSFGK